MTGEPLSPELVLVASAADAAAARAALPPPLETPLPPLGPPPRPRSAPVPRRPQAAVLFARARRGAVRFQRPLLGAATALIAGVALASVHHPDAAPTLSAVSTPSPLLVRRPAHALAVPGAAYVSGRAQSFTVSRNGRSILRLRLTACGTSLRIAQLRIVGNAFTGATRSVIVAGVFTSPRRATLVFTARRAHCATRTRHVVVTLS